MKILFFSLILLFGHAGHYEAGRFNTLEECKAAQAVAPEGWNKSPYSYCVVKFEGTYKPSPSEIRGSKE